MEYEIKKLKNSQLEIKITVPDEKMPEFRKKACDQISKDVKVKGFRPGHVPPNVLENYVEKKYIDAHTHEIAIQRTYAEVVVKEKLQVVSRPKVKIDSDSPLVYTATVAILPEVKVKDYHSIKVDKKEPKVTEKDIQAVLDDLNKYATTYKDVDREAKKGDRVEVDFEGFDKDGKPLENTKSQNHPVILGEGSLIPGFEENLIGCKKNEKKEFDITFPKDYGKKDFQGKKVKFKAEIKRIEEPQTQELNEELIQKMTGKKMSVDELKKDVEKNIKARKEQEEKQRQENEYLEKLLKKTDVEIPDQLVDEETQFILEDMKADIEKKGMQFEKFLEQAKATEDDLRKKYRPEAEKRIKIRLALQHLIQEEKIKVEENEIKEELEKIKKNYPPQEEAKIEQEFNSGHLKSQLTNRLALRKLFKKVLH